MWMQKRSEGVCAINLHLVIYEGVRLSGIQRRLAQLILPCCGCGVGGGYRHLLSPPHTPRRPLAQRLLPSAAQRHSRERDGRRSEKGSQPGLTLWPPTAGAEAATRPASLRKGRKGSVATNTRGKLKMYILSMLNTNTPAVIKTSAPCIRDWHTLWRLPACPSLFFSSFSSSFLHLPSYPPVFSSQLSYLYYFFLIEIFILPLFSVLCALSVGLQVGLDQPGLLDNGHQSSLSIRGKISTKVRQELDPLIILNKC